MQPREFCVTGVVTGDGGGSGAGTGGGGGQTPGTGGNGAGTGGHAGGGGSSAGSGGMSGGGTGGMSGGGTGGTWAARGGTAESSAPAAGPAAARAAWPASAACPGTGGMAAGGAGGLATGTIVMFKTLTAGAHPIRSRGSRQQPLVRRGRGVEDRAHHHQRDDHRVPDHDREAPAPADIVSLGGFLWFMENNINKIGKCDTNGTMLAEFPIMLGTASTTIWLAAGPDGNIWYTDGGNDNIGRMTTGWERRHSSPPTAGQSGPHHPPGPTAISGSPSSSGIGSARSRRRARSAQHHQDHFGVSGGDHLG